MVEETGLSCSIFLKKDMITNTHPASCCKQCRLYHGANRLVCAAHPYGPDDKFCSDFEARIPGQVRPEPLKNQIMIATDPWTLRKKLLVASLIFSCMGYGIALWWVETEIPVNQPAPESLDRNLPRQPSTLGNSQPDQPATVTDRSGKRSNR